MPTTTRNSIKVNPLGPGAVRENETLLALACNPPDAIEEERELTSNHSQVRAPKTARKAYMKPFMAEVYHSKSPCQTFAAVNTFPPRNQQPMSLMPNLLFVFGDQWRAQAFGYAGDPNARTPRIDGFASESVHFTNAIASTPVCCPWRAALM